MNYKFDCEEREVSDEDYSYRYTALCVAITFYRQKVKYRNAVMKKLVNKKDDVKLMKVILRDWARGKKKELNE